MVKTDKRWEQVQDCFPFYLWKLESINLLSALPFIQSEDSHLWNPLSLHKIPTPEEAKNTAKHMAQRGE